MSGSLRISVLVLVALAVVVLGAAPAQAGCGTTANVGCWTFDEPAGITARDASPAHNDGLYVGGPARVTPAVSGRALSVGSLLGGSALIADATSLHVGDTFTFEGWVRRTSDANSVELVNKGLLGLQLTLMNRANGSKVWLRKAGVTTIARSTAPVPADGVFHHIAVTKDGTGSGSTRIFVDGVEGTTIVAPSQKLVDTVLPLTIGGTPLAPALFDEFALYDAVLTPAQVQERYETTGASLDGDGDGVPDVLERRLGADPLKLDTDGDGLRDRFEILDGLPFHEPAKADTDGDGIRDGQEDVDEDGLTASAEQAAGTSPLQPDADDDDLRDGAEVNQYHTDPGDPDSDDDGLDDGAEARAGTDALRSDSDGDGVRDGSETLTATAQRGDVRVELTGRGDLAGDFRIAPKPGDDLLTDGPGQAGDPVELTLAPDAAPGFQHARVTVGYDPARAGGSEADLRLFFFDETHGLWIPASDDQSVDTAANEVSAVVDHFSIYAVFNIRNWRESWTALAGTCRPGGTGQPVLLDVAFVLDSSGSMSSNDPQGFRRTASKNFVDAMLTDDRGAVIDFDDSARLLQSLTSSKTALKTAIDRIDANGGTNIGAGVSTGLAELTRSTDTTRGRVMILLTDGQGSYNPTLTAQAGAAGVTVYTIGLGNSVDESLLRTIARETGGTYNQVDEASDLPQVFRDIQDDQGDDGTDTDGDGLTDCVEQQGMPDAAGYLTFTSDPRLADTDGDGLTDGEEVGDGARLADVLEDALEPLGMDPPEDVGDGIVYRVFSDPRVDDSDADGLSDPEEADFGSRARSTETDGDGLSDEREMQIGTDPTDVNTDGDGRDDGYEDTHRDADFDPLEPDEEMSAGDYVTQFMKGAVCRNPWMSLCDDDSIAWLAGNIAAGFFAVPDILDAVGQIYHLDVVGAGTSLISIVPLGGDALSVVVKTRTFIGRNPTQSGPALRRLMHDPNFPAAHKIDLLNHVYGPELARLRNNGLTDTHAIKLVAGRVDLKLLDDTIQAARRTTSGNGYLAWDTAENKLRAATGGRKESFEPRPRQIGARGYRYVDAWDQITQIAREAKTGYARLTPFVQRQIDKDLRLLADGRAQGIEWHFYPSSITSRLGPSRPLLDELQRRGIAYVIHLP